MSKVLAVVPARGGSKGIKDKNIRDLGGKPLIYYQLKNAIESNADEVVLATDNYKIARVCCDLFGDKFSTVWRDSSISGDFSKTEDTLLHVLALLDADIIVTLEPTNPLNRTQYVNECIQKVFNGWDSAGCFVKDYGWFYGEDILLERPMKQDAPTRLRETGNCWATRADVLRKTHNRLGGVYEAVLIPWEHSVHLDSEVDWRVAETLLKKEYFIPREGSRDYEQTYWGVVVDPDGKVRDRKEEFDIYARRNKEKIDYLNQLSGRILDVGCGYGFLLKALNDDWGKHGVDISKLATGIAKKYGGIFCGTLEKASYDSDYFDAIVLNHIIEHLKDPISLIKEVGRILKPNGKLILETPDFDCGVAKRFGKNFRLLKDSGHISLFSQWGVYQLLQDNLFEIERVSYPYFETDYFTEDNFRRLQDVNQVSPPFYGNTVTFYAYKK